MLNPWTIVLSILLLFGGMMAIAVVGAYAFGVILKRLDND